MSFEKLKILYQEIILENAQNPHNHGIIAEPTYQTTVYNPNCGDRINLYLNMDTNNKITEISFNGKGCTISQASASLMTQAVKGKSKNEAIKIAEIFSDLIIGNNRSTEELGKLGDAKILANVIFFPVRIKCATLSWWALNRILLGKDRDENND